MHVAPFILKIRYMLFLTNNAVSLFRHLIIYFSLICMGCRNSDKVYVANSRKFTLTGPHNFLLHAYTLLLL